MSLWPGEVSPGASPSRQECVAAFWDIVGPAVVDLVRSGKVDSADFPDAPGAEEHP
ncbi:hypothetical protein [Kineococcus terrestris]|uniref:hypothetical protein n=1 Tax=Kineococcus terrestris TaxID=2044856 RepID=UPI0034DB3795